MDEVAVECNNRKPQSHGNFHYLIQLRLRGEATFDHRGEHLTSERYCSTHHFEIEDRVSPLGEEQSREHRVSMHGSSRGNDEFDDVVARRVNRLHLCRDLPENLDSETAHRLGDDLFTCTENRVHRLARDTGRGGNCGNVHSLESATFDQSEGGAENLLL